ncbi:MAG: hypothetical protein C4583_03050 [Anaerolineaceae bacterium]|nr:MAG: hypothetical protein C4583_03050 [Anaerolineaceae bacterium]
MVDLVVTATQVLPSSGDTEKGIAGEAITAGQAVYKRATDGYWLKAQCDGTAEEAGATNCGIALVSALAANAPIVVALPGSIVTLGAGAAPAAGTIYCIAAAAGGIAPSADMATTNKVTVLAIGIGSNQVLVARVYNAGSVKP